MQHRDEIAAILKQVDSWPPEAMEELERQLRWRTQQRQRPVAGPALSIDHLAGIAKGSGTPPSDEQVRQWIEAHRSQRYE